MTSQIKLQIVIRIKSRDVKQTLEPKPLKAIQADKSLDRKQLKSEIVFDGPVLLDTVAKTHCNPSRAALFSKKEYFTSSLDKVILISSVKHVMKHFSLAIIDSQDC